MVVPGLVVWGVLPWFFGPAAQLSFLVVGAVVGLAVLAVVVRTVRRSRRSSRSCWRLNWW